MQDLENQIASRAYERFLARGGEHGHDVEDWLAAEAEVTRTPYDVVLVDAGRNNIELVRVLRELTGRGLPEIKTLIASKRPTRVASLAEAERYREAMEAVGAHVELQAARS